MPVVALFLAPASSYADPVISGLDPISAIAGGPAFTLTVNGSGFGATSTVRWNGSNRSTTFASGDRLTAAISAADIANAGTARVDGSESRFGR